MLVKEHCDILAPAIQNVNVSLSTGVFDNDWKQAIINPLLKKQNIDLENYRLVSNLSFLSKLVEKASRISVTQHMNQHQLPPSYQSAYRANYSTETLTLKI
ncbi:hypothetical protein SNE40_013047 [Patella caerulea]|uniref:Uncharacterized protein n=1 Tax=Patella caerulea TaxID=87958 RepID=A0AAN8JM85_PATCE